VSKFFASFYAKGNSVVSIKELLIGVLRHHKIALAHAIPVRNRTKILTGYSFITHMMLAVIDFCSNAIESEQRTNFVELWAVKVDCNRLVAAITLLGKPC
jgi:hypothetical protein